MGKYKLGIFDHSGVLSDDRLPVHESNVCLLERYCPGKKNPSFEEWLKMSHASAGEFILSQGGTAPIEEINEEYRRVYQEINNREENPIIPVVYEDAHRALFALKRKGLQLAIVSSHPQDSLMDELNRYGLLPLFDLVSGDPSPKDTRLIKICDSLSRPKEEAFFVEDTIYGLRSGHKARVDCFGITTGYHSRERLEGEGTAIKVVGSLTELVQLI